MKTALTTLALATLLLAPVTASDGAKDLEGFTPPEVVYKLEPSYTKEAREEGVEGLVQLEVEIGTDGVVREVEVTKGLPAGLTESAVAAVHQWRFRPARDAEGRALAVRYTLTINFALDEEEKGS